MSEMQLIRVLCKGSDNKVHSLGLNNTNFTRKFVQIYCLRYLFNQLGQNTFKLGVIGIAY